MSNRNLPVPVITEIEAVMCSHSGHGAYARAAEGTRDRVKQGLIEDAKRMMFGRGEKPRREGETIEQARKGGITL